MRLFICLIFMLTASACYGQKPQGLPQGSTINGGESSATRPFEIIDNRIFVEIKLNGQGPFRVIFDTGGDNIMTPEVARSLGLKVDSAGKSGGTGEALVERGQTTVAEMQIGDLSFKHQDFAVISFSDAPNVFGSARVDGIIGLQVLQRFVVKIDYQHQLLTFTEPTAFVYKGDGQALSFERPRLVPVVDAELDGIPARFGIDTGARTSLILYGPFVEKNNLRARYEPKVEGITGWGIGGPIRSQVARVGQLKLGAFVLRDVVARLSLQRSGALTSAEMAGLIGPDVLKQFNLYLNYSRSQLILEKNSSFGIRDTYDRAGMWLGQEGGYFQILDIVAHGPAAAAGLKVGDKILAIDGESTDKLLLPTVRLRLRSEPPEKRVRLLVQSGSVKREIVISLKELV